MYIILVKIYINSKIEVIYIITEIKKEEKYILKFKKYKYILKINSGIYLITKKQKYI